MWQLMLRYQRKDDNYLNGIGLTLKFWAGPDEKKGKVRCLDLRLFRYLY